MATRSEHIRIFLSSPGDVGTEREAVAALVETLNLNQPDAIRIELVRWEDSYYSAAGSFQEQIASPADCDLMIVILWSRIGTPLAPDRFARPDGSAYRSGTEYEFEAAVGAARADGTPDIFVYRKTAPPSLAPGDASAEAQWAALQAFWSQWFVDGKGHMVAAYHDFPSVDAFEHKIGSHLRQWLRDRRQLETAAWPESMGSPFRGLEAFDEAHAPVFFGRRRAVRQAQRRLGQAAGRGCPFLLIVGRSGIGKSSFVRAGLIPALRRSDELGLGEAVVCGLRAEAGLDGLCTALIGLAAGQGEPGDADPLAGLADRARSAPGDAALVVAKAFRVPGGAESVPGASRLIVYLDQFETLFALPAEEQAALSAFIDALVRGRAAQVIATLRSDLYRRFQDNALLVRLKDDGAAYDLLPPEPRDIGDMIRGPALAAGLIFEYDPEREIGLDEVLLRAAGEPDALPLLEFTLDELYKRRTADETGQPGRHGSLTFAAYAELGGLEGAIAGRAEAEFAALDADARATLPAVLRACVTSAGPRDDRLIAQPVPLRRFPPGSDARRLIDRLADPVARLLVVVGDGDDPVVRLAHEALLTHWPRAVEQLEIDRQLILARARLIEQGTRWDAADGADRDSLLLAPGLPLSEAEAVVARDSEGLPPQAAAFVRASAAAHLGRLEREALEAQKRVRRARVVSAVIGVLGLTTAGAAVVGFQFWREAEDQAAFAQQQATLAEDRAAQAEQERAAAERYLELAAESAYQMVEGVANRLRDVAGVRTDLIAEILGEAEVMLQTIEAVGERASDTMRHIQALTYFSLARSNAVMGDVTAALDRSSRARALLEELIAQPDAPVEWWSDLVVIINNQANLVLSQLEDPERSAALFREAIALGEAALERAPDQPELQRRVAGSHLGLGDALWELGDFAGAQAEYQIDLEATEAMYARFPDEDWAKRDMTVSLNRLGAWNSAVGHLAEALDAHRRALVLSRELYEAAPDDTSRISDLSHALGLVAAVLRRQRHPAEAIEVMRESMELSNRLVALDPSNLSHRRSLMVDHERISLAAWDMGDYTTAREHMETSQAMLEALAEADRTNMQWQLDAAYGLGRQAALLLELGENDRALALLAEQATRIRQLAEDNPNLPEIGEELSFALEAQANAAAWFGDSEGALALYRESQANMEALVAARPEDTRSWLALTQALSGVGRMEQALGELEAARETLQSAVDISTRLTEENPDNPELLRNLSLRVIELAIVLSELGDVEGMAAAYLQDFEIAVALAELDPSNLEWQRDLFISHATMSDVEAGRGDFHAAHAHLEASMEIMRRLVALEGGPVQWQSDFVNIHLWLAENAQQRGEEAEMLDYLAEGRRLAEARAAASPEDPSTADDLERVDLYESVLLATPAPSDGGGE